MPHSTAPVALLTSSYPSPDQPYRGGFVRSIARRLAADGPVEVLCPRLGASAPRRESEGRLTVRRFPVAGARGSLKSLPGVPLLPITTLTAGGLAALARAQRRLGPRAVLYAHWAAPSGFIAALAARPGSRPLVVHCHGSDINTAPDRGALIAAGIRYALRRADQVIAVSGALERTIRERYRVPEGRLHVIPCGVDTARFSPGDRAQARAALQLAPSGTLLTYVGDLIREKGVELLLEAAAPLIRSGADLTLQLIGGGELRPALLERAEALGVAQRFRLLGPQPNDRIPALLRASDALILPSFSEGTPVSVLEARAVGLPVLATAVGGIPDVVADGAEGILFPPRDAGALSDALERFLALDAERLRRMRENILADRARFDISTQAAGIRQIIEAAASRRM